MKLKTEEWKEFRVGDWFSVETCKGVDAGSLFLNKNYSEDAPYEFVGRTNDNYGLQGYVGDLGFPFNDSGTITISQVGTIVAQLRTSKYYTSQNVFKLTPLNFVPNRWILLFVVSMLNKVLVKYTGYASYPTQKSLNNKTILLPSKNNEPDWDSMEEYIKKIEEKYIEKVDEYNQENIQKALKIVGLTMDDLSSDLNIEPAKRYEKFRIGDLFEIRPTKNHKLTNDELYVVNGKNRVIANSSQCNGIGGYTNFENTEAGNMITFSDTTDHNAIFYQPDDFVGYSHVQGLYPLSFVEKWNRETYLYFLAVFKKKASGKGFSYGNKFNRRIASNMTLLLPAIDENTPDFDYMEKAIYIYTKKVIKSWQMDSEKEVRALKSVIDKD